MGDFLVTAENYQDVARAAWGAKTGTAGTPNPSPSDPLFSFDDDRGFVDITWGGHLYSMELKRVDTPDKLLGFIQHLSRKSWKGMTPKRIGQLITALSDRFGWDVHV